MKIANLENADLAVSRVQERVKLGGHFVPETTIRRRYTSGLKNFFSLYESIADSWRLYNNSSMDHIIPIASKHHNQLEIYNDSIWQTLVETYDETSKT